MMQYFYSPSTGGFYLVPDIHEAAPDDAVPISTEEHARLQQEQCAGKRIVAGKDGNPVAVDPVLSDDALALIVRRRRSEMLRQSDWTAMSDSELGKDQKAAWKMYRAALRRVPDQPDFPRNIQWPQAPA